MKKQGFVERAVMGAPAGEDFSPAKLPSNRRSLFWQLLKHKYYRIFQNHWLTVPFFLPLMVWSVLTMGYTDQIFSLEAGEGVSQLLEYWFTVYVTAIPLWALAFWGLAGGLNVLRKLAWGDPVMPGADFLQGLKSSGKQTAGIGLAWGAASALIRFAIDWLSFYDRLVGPSNVAVFGIFLCWFVLAALLGITVYMTCMACIYRVTPRQLIVGAAKLYWSDLFLATGVLILSLSPLVIPLLTDLAIVTLAVYFLVAALLLGVMIIPPFLVCQHSFDRVINKKDYPDYYGRGLSYGASPRKAEDPADGAVLTAQPPAPEEPENDFERVTDEN